MNIRRSIAGLLTALALTLAGCGLPTLNPEADAAARRIYTAVQNGTDLSRDAGLAADLRTPDALARLQEARSLIPKSPPQSVENRGWRFSTTTAGGSADLVHAYRYPDCTVVAETVLRKPPGARHWLIVGFHVHREDPSPEQLRLRPDPALRPEQT